MGAPKFNYWVCVRNSPIPSYESRWAEGCPMPDCYLRGRPVYLGDADYGSEAEDSYYTSAWWADTDEELTDDDLDALTNEHADRLAASWFEYQVGRAEYLRD